MVDNRTKVDRKYQEAYPELFKTQSCYIPPSSSQPPPQGYVALAEKWEKEAGNLLLDATYTCALKQCAKELRTINNSSKIEGVE